MNVKYFSIKTLFYRGNCQWFDDYIAHVIDTPLPYEVE